MLTTLPRPQSQQDLAEGLVELLHDLRALTVAGRELLFLGDGNHQQLRQALAHITTAAELLGHVDKLFPRDWELQLRRVPSLAAAKAVLLDALHHDDEPILKGSRCEVCGTQSPVRGRCVVCDARRARARKAR